MQLRLARTCFASVCSYADTILSLEGVVGREGRKQRGRDGHRKRSRDGMSDGYS